MHMLDLARVAAETERGRNFFQRVLALVVPGIPEHFSRIVALNARVEGLAQLNFPVTNIFVTFETEEDQRLVLTKLSVGTMQSRSNVTSALSDHKYLFRGKYVLSACEPDEPNTIRWEDLNTGVVQRIKELIITSFCTFVSLVLVAYLTYLADKSRTVLGAAIT